MCPGQQNMLLAAHSPQGVHLLTARQQVGKRVLSFEMAIWQNNDMVGARQDGPPVRETRQIRSAYAKRHSQRRRPVWISSDERSPISSSSADCIGLRLPAGISRPGFMAAQRIWTQRDSYPSTSFFSARRQLWPDVIFLHFITDSSASGRASSSTPTHASRRWRMTFLPHSPLCVTTMPAATGPIAAMATLQSRLQFPIGLTTQQHLQTRTAPESTMAYIVP